MFATDPQEQRLGAVETVQVQQFEAGLHPNHQSRQVGTGLASRDDVISGGGGQGGLSS